MRETTGGRAFGTFWRLGDGGFCSEDDDRLLLLLLFDIDPLRRVDTISLCFFVVLFVVFVLSEREKQSERERV